MQCKSELGEYLNLTNTQESNLDSLKEENRYLKESLSQLELKHQHTLDEVKEG